MATPVNFIAARLIQIRRQGGRGRRLRLQFEALSQFSPEEKQIAKTLLESLILRHTANRFSQAS